MLQGADLWVAVLILAVASPALFLLRRSQLEEVPDPVLVWSLRLAAVPFVLGAGIKLLRFLVPFEEGGPLILLMVAAPFLLVVAWVFAWRSLNRRGTAFLPIATVVLIVAYGLLVAWLFANVST